MGGRGRQRGCTQTAMCVLTSERVHDMGLTFDDREDSHPVIGTYLGTPHCFLSKLQSRMLRFGPLLVVKRLIGGL
eukprot:971600-Amphidinium_carterae.2